MVIGKWMVKALQLAASMLLSVASWVTEPSLSEVYRAASAGLFKDAQR